MHETQSQLNQLEGWKDTFPKRDSRFPNRRRGLRGLLFGLLGEWLWDGGHLTMMNEKPMIPAGRSGEPEPMAMTTEGVEDVFPLRLK